MHETSQSSLASFFRPPPSPAMRRTLGSETARRRGRGGICRGIRGGVSSGLKMEWWKLVWWLIHRSMVKIGEINLFNF